MLHTAHKQSCALSCGPCCWHCNSLGIFMGHFSFVYFLLVVRVHVALLQLQQKNYGRLLVRASRRLAAKPSSGACDAAVGAACSRSPLASPRAPSTERGRQFRGSLRGEGRPRAQRHSRCAAPAGLRSKPAVLQRLLGGRFLDLLAGGMSAEGTTKIPFRYWRGAIWRLKVKKNRCGHACKK